MQTITTKLQKANQHINKANRHNARAAMLIAIAKAKGAK